VTCTPDGRTIKSSTIILRDTSGRVLGALCVNIDITGLRLAVSSLAALAGLDDVATAPVTVFSDNVGEVIRAVMAQEEQRLGRALRYDTRPARLEIVRALDSRGVFSLAQAASEVARYLGVSRATVYADLNALRGP
jgi:predicted transcriptional regulator YheO